MPKATAKASKANTGDGHGEIRADTLYALPTFMLKSGLGQAAMRTARRNGLRVRRIGRRAYVLGQGRHRVLQGRRLKTHTTDYQLRGPGHGRPDLPPRLFPQ